MPLTWRASASSWRCSGIHSGTIHTGEFFHGPFEVTDANTPFVIQVSEGSTRELDERCLKFLHTYAKRIEVLDAKELGLSVIDPAVVDYFNHSLFNNVYPIYNHALAEDPPAPADHPPLYVEGRILIQTERI